MTLNVTFGYWLKQWKNTVTVQNFKMSLVLEQMMIQKDNHTESSFLTYPALGLCSPLQALLGQDERHVL